MVPGRLGQVVPGRLGQVVPGRLGQVVQQYSGCRIADKDNTSFLIQNVVLYSRELCLACLSHSSPFQMMAGGPSTSSTTPPPSSTPPLSQHWSSAPPAVSWLPPFWTGWREMSSKGISGDSCPSSSSPGSRIRPSTAKLIQTGICIYIQFRTVQDSIPAAIFINSCITIAIKNSKFLALSFHSEFLQVLVSGRI